MRRSMKLFLESLAAAFVLTGLSYLVGHYAGWLETLDPLEVFCVFTSYSCTYLCVKETRWNYPMGAISTAAYSYLFWGQGLYASAALNAYLAPALVYGWLRWGADPVTRPVAHVELRWIPVYLLVTAGTYGAVLLILRLLDASLPVPDTAILILTMLAQFLLDNKKIETWAVWAVVNVLAIWTYSEAGLPLVASQYFFFLINTLYGWQQWGRSIRLGQNQGAAA